MTKVAAILIGDLPAIVFLVGHAVLVAAISPLSEPYRWVVVPGLVLALGFAVAVGMSFSLTARRVVGAVTATFLALIVAPYAAGFLNVMATLSLEELGFHQMVKPLAVTVIGVMALLAILLALWQGRSVGYRTPLYAGCYVLLLAFGFAIVTALGRPGFLGTSGASEVSFSVGILLMPGLTTFGVFSHGDLAFAAVAGVMQASILIWCVVSSLWSFEAQARRQ